LWGPASPYSSGSAQAEPFPNDTGGARKSEAGGSTFRPTKTEVEKGAGRGSASFEKTQYETPPVATSERTSMRDDGVQFYKYSPLMIFSLLDVLSLWYSLICLVYFTSGIPPSCSFGKRKASATSLQIG